MSTYKKREEWRSNYGFLMAALGSAIGLGNIWRFSYIAYESGGGAFLIPYFIALLSVGIPLLILEFGIGHERLGSPPLAFVKYSKKWEWLGWWMVSFLIFGIAFYYTVIISWCVNYVRYALNLSWGKDVIGFFNNDFLGKTGGPFEFGSLQLEIVLGLFLVWFLGWYIIYKGVRRGLEIANKVFIPLLLLLMSILVVWSFTLEGAGEGLKSYFVPDFSKLWEPKVWLNAYSQVFFSLGLGFGIMITYSSYLPKDANIPKAAITTALIDSGFAIFAGVAIFAILGFMAQSSGKGVEEVVADGIGLAFIAYPQALNLMHDTLSPFIGKAFGILFFVSLVVAGFSSAISIIEAFVSAIVDKFLWSRKVVVTVVTLLGFLGGIIFATGAGIYWIDIVDHFLTTYGVVVVGFLECLVVGWIFHIYLFREHINKTTNIHLGQLWDYVIRFMVPLILLVIIGTALIKDVSSIYGNYKVNEVLLIGVGWLSLTLVIAFILTRQGWRHNISEHKSRTDEYVKEDI